MTTLRNANTGAWSGVAPTGRSGTGTIDDTTVCVLFWGSSFNDGAAITTRPPYSRGRLAPLKSVYVYFEEMQTERTTSSLPPWRCAECTVSRQFAMTRIPELSRTPTGKLMAVVEYRTWDTREES
jgi:hypothetical protein